MQVSEEFSVSSGGGFCRTAKLLPLNSDELFMIFGWYPAVKVNSDHIGLQIKLSEPHNFAPPPVDSENSSTRVSM